ncbi:murein biosynthesis integral membrane protein MurJ [Halobacillus locisalis]|uniref:Probable lipid II flippase MurJ n=2 Tax=Halobacillus locisalis TaxID=220753 RepID=A0A838CPR7_9BACI|nr:murein biosynthesis integral membrane protein MurJ [Halobacillus locisalis]
MKKAVVTLMVLTILSKVFGFLRDVTLSYFYGASGVSDAYIIAITIPTVIFGLIAAGISTGYIPMYSRIEEEEGDLRAKQFTNQLISVLILASTFVLVLGWVFTEPLVRVFAKGFEGDILQLAITFTRWSLFGIYFTILIRILSAYLNYHKQFAVPNLIGIPMSLVVILSIYISFVFDFAVLLAAGYVVGLAVQLVMLTLYAYKHHFRYRWQLDFRNQYMKQMLIIAIPVIIGTAATQLNRLVDRTLASDVTVGGVSAMNYAQSLNGIIHGVFVVSITTVMYPMITKMATKQDMNGMKKALNQSMVSVIMLVVPATIGAMIFAKPIVELLFNRGAFGEDAVNLTTSAYFYYSLGMVAIGLRVVLSQAFYAQQDTKTPMINTAIAMVVNILLSFILVRSLGIGGIALATTIAAFFTTFLLLIRLRQKVGKLRLRGVMKSTIKIVIASSIMGVVSFLFYSRITSVLGLNLALIVTVLLAALLYAFLLIVFKVEEVKALTDKLGTLRIR